MPRPLNEIEQRAEELADWFEAWEPTEADFQREVPSVMAIKLAAWRRDCAERELAEAVRSARKANMSWRELGEAIGTSGEAARQRYRDVS